MADEGDVRCGVLSQRGDLFRQTHPAQSVRAACRAPGAGRLVVRRTLRKSVRRQRSLQTGGPHGVPEIGMRPACIVGSGEEQPVIPTALPQFGHIRRAWDPMLNRSLARLLPGEYYVTSHDEVLF